jgi:hypothetical protein
MTGMAAQHAGRDTDPAPRPASRALDPFLAAFLVVAAVFLFWGLGRRDLWQDEAETAMLAKNILRFKLPIVYDGVNLVSPEVGRGFGPDLLWRWSPWLQFYLTAASFAIFGITTWAARLPSAVLGLLCVALTFFFARRTFGSERQARLSAVLLGLSVPFLLHCRQARWYALSYLLVVCLFYALFELEQRPKVAGAALALSAVLLFYTNYFVAIGLLIALCIAVPILGPGRTFWKGFGIALLAAAVGMAPGIVFFDVLGKAGPFLAENSASLLVSYADLFLAQLLPLPMLILLVWVLLRRRTAPYLDPVRKRRAHFLLACIGLYICYLAMGPWELFRYLTPVLPLCAVLLAVALDGLLDSSRIVGGALLALLICTDALHSIPTGLVDCPGTEIKDRYGRIGPVSFPLAGFLYEITHDFRGCSQALAAYLKANARPTDVVLVSYGDSPLQFYTGLKVVGAFQGQKLSDQPDWVVLHPYVIDFRPGRDLAVVRFIYQHVDLARYYERVKLPCHDFMQGNCTEPQLHLFQEPAEGRELKVFRRTARQSLPQSPSN